MAKRKLPAPLKAAEAVRNDIGKLQHDQGIMRDELRQIRKNMNDLLQTMEVVVGSIRYEPTGGYRGGPVDPQLAAINAVDAAPNHWGKGLPENAGECTVHSTSPTNKIGEPMKTLESGAVRSTGCMNARYDLINPVGMRRLAETYAEGAKKYGDSNWQKGIDTPNLLNHAITHIEAWRNGDTSEDHMAHAVWNLFTIMYTEERLPHLVIRHYAPGFNPDNDPTNVKLRK
jgi:hypothetical protein